MKRICCLALCLLILLGGCARKEETVVTYLEFDNMQGIPADDPYMVAQNGAYYYCWSDDNAVWVARVDHPADPDRAKGVKVYEGKTDDLFSIWAPELHYLAGKWYIYAAMCQGSDDNARHRMYCLEGEDPLSNFTLKAQLTDETDRWAIDGTVFSWNGELYTIWSGWPGSVDGAQNLYIAHMANPWTIDSQRVAISRPDSWDAITQNPCVNEGPCVVTDGETLYCLFSGNGSWTDDYAVGFLTLTGEDLLSPDSWEKSDAPILKKQAGFYGPGHCSVTAGADGGLYILYHANLESGTGWYGRSFRIQKLTLGSDGPTLGRQETRVEIPVEVTE